MLFGQVTDRPDIEPACKQFAAAWSMLEEKGVVLATDKASAKEWLAHIVIGLTAAMPGSDIPSLAVRQFLATVPLIFP